MTPYRIRFTPQSEEDLLHLYDFPLESDVGAAERALDAIKPALDALRFSPFSCRKAIAGNSFFRELVIPFGSTGHVALFEIEPKHVLTIVAVRHQREEDYQ